MYVLHKQVKARADLKKVWQYSFEEHGEAQADKYYDELIVGMETIRDNPKIGVACDRICKEFVKVIASIKPIITLYSID